MRHSWSGMCSNCVLAVFAATLGWVAFATGCKTVTIFLEALAAPARAALQRARLDDTVLVIFTVFAAAHIGVALLALCKANTVLLETFCGLARTTCHG